MNSKGVIKLFAILLTIACLYELSFTFITRKVESDAKEYADGDAIKERDYLDSMKHQKVWMHWLGVGGYTYQETKEKELNLGLDLKGGMNVTMEVSVVDLIKAMSDNSTDSTFTNAIARAQEMQKSSGDDFVTLFGRAFEEIDPNAKLAAIFGAVRGKNDKITFNSTNEEVLTIIREEANGAIDRTYQILSTRVDRFGVAQANIQKVGTSGRILIEMPGVKEPERVRKLLQGTAKLEFWDTYQNVEVYKSLELANERLKAIKKVEKALKDSLEGKVDEGDKQASAPDTSKKSEEFAFLNDSNKAAVADSLTAAKEENPLFMLLYPNVVQAENGYQLGQGPMVGRCLVRDTAAVNAMLQLPEVKSVLPPNLKLLWTAKPERGQKGDDIVTLIAIKTKGLDNKAPLEGDAVVDARPDFGQNNQVEISMTMNADGASIWKQMTAAASKQTPKASVAVVLDDYVYSYPTVEGEIPNGRTAIHGDFTLTEAEDLSNVLNAGKLPAPARIVEEAVVGPSLGQEAIHDGLVSFAIALLLVLIFMYAYYNNAGWVANVALLLNLFFLIGVLASFGAVLTLPGILGIVLTMGMAVDANVLINERVREELNAGVGLRTAIERGYSKAFSAILDSNITTILTGIILAIFGSGPVQGFAITLVIGIITSFVTGVFITRIVFLWLLDKKVEIPFSTKITQGLFKNLNIDFISKRKLYYAISGIVIGAGIVSMVVRGFDYGIDFSGGRSYVVQFENPVETEQLRSALAPKLGGSPEIKVYGADNKFKVTTDYLINKEDADNEVQASLNEGLLSLNNTYEIQSSQKVGPTVADEIKQAAVLSVLASILVIFLYIWARFRSVSFSTGAVVALFHDVMITLSLYSLCWGFLPFAIEIDKAFIAAILTVIGYSINDTVVVFDRIRENVSDLHKLQNEQLIPSINKALNDTLSRTINTALTVIIVLMASFLLGGEIVRGFAFALLIGVVAGVYSSVCIATPIVVDLPRKKSTAVSNSTSSKEAVLAK